MKEHPSSRQPETEGEETEDSRQLKTGVLYRIV